MLKAELAQAPTDTIKKYRVVFAEGNGVAWDQALSFNAQQDIEVTNVDRWIRGFERTWFKTTPTRHRAQVTCPIPRSLDVSVMDTGQGV